VDCVAGVVWLTLAACGGGHPQAPLPPPTPPPAPKVAERTTNAQAAGVADEAGCGSADANPDPDNLGAISAAVLCLLNGERAQRGLPLLRSNGQLRRAATGMATSMVSQGFFAHVTPSGQDVVDRVRRTGYVHGDWALGENLAWGNGPLATPQAIVNAWMSSRGHRSNILFARFRDIGIGIQLGAPGQDLSGGATYVTDFGRHT
jgi:uncharacterized protein YkwD